VIPAFDERGNLPPGIHKADWRELEAAFGGSVSRALLLTGFRESLALLRVAGCRTAYLDGSFVTAKAEPADFDACWEVDGVDVGHLDPLLHDFSDGRRAQKERFGGELFPADAAAAPGGTKFLDFFQRERGTGVAKGIVQIDLGTVL
jgi:hypothetical protein